MGGVKSKIDEAKALAAAEAAEEGPAAYRPGGFHPVYIGNVFGNRYKVLRKLGYGLYSTVWLVRDMEPGENSPMYKALKILGAEFHGQGNDTFEREILAHLRDGDREHAGHKYICHMLDNFLHVGPNGTHLCLVFELMGETLDNFACHFKNARVPAPAMRRIAIQLIHALDYAHTNGVIHTDIKPKNIFIRLRNDSLIERGYLRSAVPKQGLAEEQYTPIASTLLSLKKKHVDLSEFDVVLGDWGVASWKDKHLTESIQPALLRSPEVLLGAAWNESTDWWNLGAVLLEVFRRVRFFSVCPPPYQSYQLKGHLDQISHFFGPFPKRLLERSDQEKVRELFDENGMIKDSRSEYWPPLSSTMLMPGNDLAKEDRETFASFLRTMMKIDPEDRASADELLSHPWLNVEQK